MNADGFAQPPAEPPVPAPAVDPAGFRALGRRRTAAVSGIVLVLAVTVADMLWTMADVLIMGSLVPEPFAEWWAYSEWASQAMGCGYLLFLVLSGVLFIRWQRQLLRNLLTLGCQRLDPSVTLASFSWFIPLANLFVPYLSVRQATAWSVPPGGRDQRPLVSAWWLAWVLSNLTAVFTGAGFLISEDATTWIPVAAADLVSSAIYLLAGLLAIRMVTVLSSQQQARATALEHRDAAAPPAAFALPGGEGPRWLRESARWRG